MPTSLPRPLLSGLSLIGFLTLLSPAAHAQTTLVPMPNAVKPQQPDMKMLDGDKVYNFVEKMPAYLDGGMDGLQRFVAGHVRGAASGPLSFVTFVVDKEGKVRWPALGPQPADSDAAVSPELAEAFRSIGPFRAGRQNGKPMNVQYTVPLVKRVKSGQK